MTTTLGIPKTFDDVAALMATWAGVLTMLERAIWTGSSVPSIAGPPTSSAEVRVRFSTGGTVGIVGIAYQTSVDDGVTYTAPAALGTATTIVLVGITLTLGAGTIGTGDYLRWTQTDPAVVPHRFGWRERDRHEGIRRVVWEPGDDGLLGELAPARGPGGNPRSLYTLNEACAVYLEAVDETDAATAENERAQYIAARLLLDAFLRALYITSHGRVSLSDPRWVDKDNVRRYGATIRIVFALGAQVPDALQTTAYASTNAINSTRMQITNDSHDQIDTDTISATDTP